MNLSATKHNIAARLKRLSKNMMNIAADMDYYGGFAYWSRNAGASKMCEEWSSEIQAEIDHETKGEIVC